MSLIFTYIIFSLIESRKKEYLKAEKSLIQVTYNTVIEAFKVHSNILYFNKINTPKVKELLNNVNESSSIQKDKIRSDLYLEFKDMYQNMRSFKVKQLHFHLKNNESFLRFHRPNKYGDDLTNIRATVNYVNTYHKPINGFEEGRIFNGYRFVYPLSYDEKHLGSVETSVSMGSIIEEFKKFMTEEVDFVISKSVVDTKVFQNEKSNYTLCSSLPEYYHEHSVSKGKNPLIESLLNDFRKENDIKNKMASGELFNFSGKLGENYYITTFYPIKNAVSYDSVAYIIVVNRYNEFLEYKNQYLLFLAVLILLSSIMTLFVYKIDKDKELLVHQDEILDEVQKIGHLGYWELDLAKNHLVWSAETYHIFGLLKEEFQERYEDFLKHIHPEDVQKVRTAYTQSVKNKTPNSIEHRIITKNGEVKYVEDEWNHTIDSEGNVIQSLGTIHDITEIKLYQQEIEKTKEQFESLVSHMPDIVYRCENDEYFTMLYLNDAVNLITGYSADELKLNRVLNFSSIIHSDDLNKILILIQKAIDENIKHESIEYRIIRKDKQIIWVKDSFEIVRDENNIYIEGVISDITAQKESYDKLQKFIDTQESIVILTNGDKINFANKRLFDFLGFRDLSHFQAVHDCICELFVEDDKFFHLGKIAQDVNWVDFMQTLPQLRRIVSIKDTNEKEHIFSVMINNFEKDLLIVSFTDISDTINEQMKLHEKTIHDKLTGAFNREYFDLNYQRHIQEVQNTGAFLGLAILDIDYFKKINDTFGHDIGDAVLKELVQEITNFSRQDDRLIRWGGEEFLLLLKVKSSEDLFKVLEHIRVIISNHHFEHIDKLTCSIGASLYLQYEDIQSTIKRADVALYNAKAKGRNKVIIE